MQLLTADLVLLSCSKACAMLKHTLEWRKDNKIGEPQAAHLTSQQMQKTTVHVLQHAHTACWTQGGSPLMCNQMSASHGSCLLGQLQNVAHSSWFSILHTLVQTHQQWLEAYLLHFLQITKPSNQPGCVTIADDMSIEEFANSRYMRDGWVYVDGNDAEGRSIVVSDHDSCP
jgi:hypothetical protein